MEAANGNRLTTKEFKTVDLEIGSVTDEQGYYDAAYLTACNREKKTIGAYVPKSNIEKLSHNAGYPVKEIEVEKNEVYTSLFAGGLDV